MAVRINDAARNGMVDELAGAFAGGTLELRTGAQPASANDTALGDVVVSITLPNPAFSPASEGVAALTGSWSGTAATSHDFAVDGWYRITGGGMVKDGDVGTELTLDDPNVIEGGTVTVTAATLTMPAG